ncbi:hypothetical protein Dimus_020388 [Dionaea muscipula]
MGKVGKGLREREVLELIRTSKGMGDPYWRYSSGAESSAPRSGYSAQLPSEPSTTAQHILHSNNDVHGSATGRLEREVLTESLSRPSYPSYLPPEPSTVAPQRLSWSNDVSVDRIEREVLTRSDPRSGYQAHLPPESSSLAPQHLLHPNDVHGLSNNHLERDVLTSSVLRPVYPAHLPSESSIEPQYLLRPNDGRAPSTDRLEREVLTSRAGAYALNDSLRIDVRAEPGLGIGTRSYPSLPEDPNLSLKREVPVGISPQIPDAMHERPEALRRLDNLPPPAGKSNILFVDGLPKDCTRREVGHLFRPFIGFKDIKVVHKEPRRSGDKATVLCFVVFDDAKCALTAMEALQGSFISS